jgi:chemotaxis-related protein WspD
MNEPGKNDSCWNRIGVRGDQSCERLPQHTHCRNCEVYGDTAIQIMQREVPADYRRRWTEQFAVEEQVQAPPDQSAVVFRIGTEWLALPARSAVTVAEAGIPQRVHRLPHRTGKSLLGVANIKGHLYPCMALGRLLDIDMEEQPATLDHRAYPRLLVVRLGEREFALPVDELHGLHRYRSAEMENPPATTGKAATRYLTGVLSIAALRIGCLDAELVGYQLAGDLK